MDATHMSVFGSVRLFSSQRCIFFCRGLSLQLEGVVGWVWKIQSAQNNSERKRHMNFFSHKLSVPPFVPHDCPWDKPGLSQGQAR